MLDIKGFNLWADGYDKSVGLSDEEGTYPFAGYKMILNTIYNYVLNCSSKKCQMQNCFKVIFQMDWQSLY